MGSERGADNDMFCTFHTSHCYDLAPDEHPCFCGAHSPCVTACAGLLHTVDGA